MRRAIGTDRCTACMAESYTCNARRGRGEFIEGCCFHCSHILIDWPDPPPTDATKGGD